MNQVILFPPPQPATETSGITKELLDAELQKRDEKINQLDESMKTVEGGLNQEKFKVPDPSEAEETTAKPTAIERLHDEKAFRDAVMSLIREKQLDDTHDLLGWTLYDLKFDISLIPGQNTSDYAEITIHMVKNSGEVFRSFNQFLLAYKEWLRTLQNEISEEAISEQARAALNGVSPEKASSWLYNLQQFDSFLIKRINRLKKKRQERFHLGEGERKIFALAIEKLRERKMGLKKKCQDPLLKRHKPGGEEFNESEVNYAIACAVQAKYTVALSDTLAGSVMVDIHDPKAKTIPEGEIHFSTVGWVNPEAHFVGSTPESTDPDGKYLFLKRVAEIYYQGPAKEGKGYVGMESYVASIEPKEYVQNISDVAARERLTNMVLALSASLPNGIGGDAYSQYVERSQEFLHAIQRQPLAVAFNSHHDNKFGWILGPRFAIDRSTLPFAKSAVAFRHTPIRHSFAVSVGLPSFLDHVCLKGSYSWINEKGKKSGGPFNLWNHSQTRPFGEQTRETPCLKKDYIHVPLIRDLKGLTKAFLTISGENTRTFKPLIYPISHLNDRNLFFLKNGKSGQTLLITGRDLWRNPQVFVGPVKASNVEVLPDMQGLLAHFDKDSFPTPNGKDSKLDLTVITSGGKDIIRKAVQIGKFVTPSSPKAVVTSPIGIKGETISVRISDMPKDFHSLIANLRPKDGGAYKEITTKFSRIDAEKFTWRLDFKKPDWDQDKVQEVVLKIDYKPNPQVENPINITQKKSPFVYFPNKEKSQPTLGSKALTITRKTKTKEVEIKEDELRITIPQEELQLFYKAYPGLLGAINSGSALLHIRASGRDFVQPIRLTPQGNHLIIAKTKLKEIFGIGKASPGEHPLNLEIEYSSAAKPLQVHGPLTVTITDSAT